MMDYKKILENILELDKKITIIHGFGDIVFNKWFGWVFKSFNEDNYRVVMGRDGGLISEAMINSNFSEGEVDREGEYEFKAVLSWDSGDEIHNGYFILEYIEFSFIQTLQERDRNLKIDHILSDSGIDFNI